MRDFYIIYVHTVDIRATLTTGKTKRGEGVAALTRHVK